jgi:hypothetical protein
MAHRLRTNFGGIQVPAPTFSSGVVDVRVFLRRIPALCAYPVEFQMTDSRFQMRCSGDRQSAIGNPLLVAAEGRVRMMV